MTGIKRILVVSPNQALRLVLAEQFRRQGFEVFAAASEPDVAGFSGDGAVFDVEAGQNAFFALLSCFDGPCGRFPVIVVGVEGERAVGWLEMGANACVPKPVRVPALIKQLDRLMRVQPPDMFKIGPFLFDGASRALTDEEGRRIVLTEKEVAVIAYLADAGERAVPREELLAEVWGYADEATTHTVETHVYRLRRKLSEISAAFLLTDDGGYRLERGGQPD